MISARRNHKNHLSTENMEPCSLYYYIIIEITSFKYFVYYIHCFSLFVCWSKCLEDITVLFSSLIACIQKPPKKQQQQQQQKCCSPEHNSLAWFTFWSWVESESTHLEVDRDHLTHLAHLPKEQHHCFPQPKTSWKLNKTSVLCSKCWQKSITNFFSIFYMLELQMNWMQ